MPEIGTVVDEIQLGRVQEAEFVVSRARGFAFACTPSCSTDRWRTGGVFAVVDPSQTA